MAPRNPDTDYTDGGKKYGMRHVPPTCDGFSVTFMCDVNCRDCRHGSCWHMDRVRMMVRRWFAVLAPEPRMGWQWKEPPPERELTKAEKADRDDCAAFSKMVMARRADAFWADFDRRWWWVPPRLWRYRDTGGFPHGALDPDATGSWGRIVREWENREDER